MNYKGLPKPLKEPTNEFVYVTWGKGDPEAGFRQADIIVENTLPRRWFIRVTSSPIPAWSKWRLTARRSSGLAARCPTACGTGRQRAQTAAGKTELNPVYIGGDFGGKGDFMDLAVVYLLSKKAGRR